MEKNPWAYIIEIVTSTQNVFCFNKKHSSDSDILEEL